MYKQTNSAGRRYRVATLLLLVLMLLAGCENPFNPASTTAPTATTGAGFTSAQATPPAQSPAPTQPVGAQAQNFPEQQAIIDVANRSRPAVVTVVNKLDVSQGYGGEARGTGMIIDTQGHIYTNEHVVAGAAEDGLSVILDSGANLPASLVGADEVSDVAVL